MATIPVPRPARPSIRESFARHPFRAAAAITGGFVLLGLTVGIIADLTLPRVPQLPDFVAQLVFVAALIALVTRLGWWKSVGYNRPSQWKDLGLVGLPAVLMIGLPLVKGGHIPGAQEIGVLVIAYILTGFFEETLMRGVIMRILAPRGVTQTVLLSGLLFALLHSVNLVLRNPVIVLAQMVGAGTSGIGLATLRLRTNTIWLVIGVHFAEDFFLKLTALPPIPVNVFQSIVMFAYGLHLLRGLRREERERAGAATATAELAPVAAV